MQRKARFLVPMFIVLFIFFAYAFRLFSWQFVDGEDYKSVADTSSTYKFKLEAQRGEILDKNGEIIVGTRTTYNLVMKALEIEGDRNISLQKAISYMNEYDIKWENHLPITIDSNGKYTFTNDESELEYLKTELLGLQSFATVDQCMTALIEKYDCQTYETQMAFDIITIRYGMTRANFSASADYVIALDIDMNFVELISELSSEMPAIHIAVSSTRYYSNGTLAPHIVGTVGSISSEQYEQFAKDGNVYSYDNMQGYSYSDSVGKSGIENYFESDLRGINGSMKVTPASETSAEILEVAQQPLAGNNVYLTLDSKLQEILNYSLAQNVEDSIQEDCVAGAAVVLDVDTFGVLSASNYPTYDLEQYQNNSDYYNSLLKDEDTPLFDRAFTGQFAPGSIVKPAVALAGLEEGIISNGFTVYCDKTYDYYEDTSIACIGAHSIGNIDVTTAIQSSCNSFFCETGRLLGIDALDIYSNLFALGTKTGIELYESSGIMTNPEEYEYNHGTSWVEGVTSMAAIGQGDSAFTPLQLATYCATIANDGVRLQTHIFDKSTTFDNSKVLKNYEPVIACDIGLKQSNLNIVQNAMRLTATQGTASSDFAYYGIDIAAKTGTAQNSNNHSDSTTFIAYAPYDDPEIAIAIVIEYGTSGQLSRNVALDFFDAYFYDKTLDEIKAKYDGTDNE